jgi:hypothetical protein
MSTPSAKANYVLPLDIPARLLKYRPLKENEK